MKEMSKLINIVEELNNKILDLVDLKAIEDYEICLTFSTDGGYYKVSYNEFALWSNMEDSYWDDDDNEINIKELILERLINYFKAMGNIAQILEKSDDGSVENLDDLTKKSDDSEVRWGYKRRNALPITDLDSIILNPDLIKSQNLSEAEVKQVKELHIIKYNVESKMEDLDPTKNKQDLLELFELWKDNEFRLQEAWKFPKNANYHRDYLSKHCTCPKLDNDDRLGTDERIVTEGCIYHSKKENK